MSRVQSDVRLPALTMAVIVALYLAHALPLYFYNVALPAIMRSQGVDLRWIGMLSLLYLPWAFKFLWAPATERYYFATVGRRRTWLGLTQLAMLLGLLALAFTGFAHQLWLFVLIGLWISSMAATQDIAIDGYTVDCLSPEQHRLGSLAQSMGVALGSLCGGAGVLWLYQVWGWQSALLCLALIVGLSLLVLPLVKEAAPAATAARASVWRTLKRPEVRWTLLLIVLYRFVEAPAMAMLTPLLIDQAWSLGEIGLLMSVAGAGVGLLAALASARALKYHSSGRLLVWAGSLRSVIYLLLATLLSAGWLQLWPSSLAVMVLLILAVRYMAMTSLYTLFMRLCSKEQAATDFTLLVCFELLVYFMGGAFSGFLAKALGYGSYYLLLGVLSVLSVLLSYWLIKKRIATALHL